MSEDRRYPAGWFEAPLAIVTAKCVRIHWRILEEPIIEDDRALAEWLRGLIDESRAKRRGRRAYVNPRVWGPILEAFDHRCVYCGASDVPLEKDHRVAVSRGGSDDPANLVPACKPCNVRKSASNPADWPMVVPDRRDA